MADINTRKASSVAVVGSGYWGKNLVRNFYDLDSLRVVCDKNEALLSRFRMQYPDIETCMNVEDVFKRKDIQAVIIATPAENHYRVAHDALSAGKHVFVEKPLALTESEGQKLVALSDRSKLILMVGHILHYHPAVMKLKCLINSGKLGKIQYLYSNRLNIGKIRFEENILWSFAPHDISTILMLLGEMPESVYATSGSYLQKQIPDTTLSSMDFPSGVKAHIFVSWLHPYKEQKLVVVGDKKMAVFDDVSQEKLLLYSHTIDWVDRIPVASKADAEIVPVEMAEPLRLECLHFLECLEKKQQPKTDGREGLRVLQVLQALQASLDSNGRMIQLGRSLTTKASQPAADFLHASSQSFGVSGNAFVHESSYIDSDVVIGDGSKVWHFSHVLSGSSIGTKCNIGQNVVIGPDVTIGNGCKIQNNVSIYKGVTLEDYVFCGPSMVFTNVYNPRSEIPRMEEVRSTLVKRGVTIGANATIVCGVTIGRYAFIGAGAVVTEDVPEYALMVGNPARQRGWMCRCGQGLTKDLKCKSCGRQFEQSGEHIKERRSVE